jgi:hypothetical protein
LINLDAAQEVGVAAALVKNFVVTVSDGKLNIDFLASVNRPSVDAIEVYSFSTPLNSPVNNSDASLPVTTISPINDFEKPTLHPNPLRDKLTLEFPAKYEGRYNIEMIDILGRKYQIASPLLRSGGSNLDIDISNLQLKPGVYTMRIFSDSKKTEVIKVIKQ